MSMTRHKKRAPSPVQKLRRLQKTVRRAKKLLADADLSHIQDHRHGKLVDIVETLRTLFGVKEWA